MVFRHVERWGCAAAACGVLAGIGSVILSPVPVDAHKFITSRYTYSIDVQPILLDKCGRCHVTGGAAPMSLLAYKDENGGAVAWAESIREVLLSGAMPPWYGDPVGPALKNNVRLSPRELDILLTWAVGGTPEGDSTRAVEAAAHRPTWALGRPDLELRPAAAHVVPAGTLADRVEFTLPTGLTEPQWIKVVDLLPGDATMVRRAVLSTDDGPPLALWQPGDDVIATPSGTAFRLRAGAILKVVIDYKKSWLDEHKEKSDLSTVGLYFTEEPLSGDALHGISIKPPAEGYLAQPTVSFQDTLRTGGRVVAVRPSLDHVYQTFHVDAVLPSNRRVALLKLRDARPEWSRRYWLTDPIELPAGTLIEVVAVRPEVSSEAVETRGSGALQVDLDVSPF